MTVTRREPFKRQFPHGLASHGGFPRWSHSGSLRSHGQLCFLLPRLSGEGVGPVNICKYLYCLLPLPLFSSDWTRAGRMSSPCVACPCSSPLHSRGAVHRLQWLWRCQRCRQWLKLGRRQQLGPGRRQRLCLWQQSQPWRWLQFWQWQRRGKWPQLCWGQQFHHQIHHHLILQQEELQALKSSYWHSVPHCLRPPVQLHGLLFRLLLFSCFLLFLVLEVELKLLSALISPLCPYLLHLSFHCSPSEGHCVCPTPEQGNFPLLSTGPGISHLPSVDSSLAVVMKTQVTSSIMYSLYPCCVSLLFAHL